MKHTPTPWQTAVSSSEILDIKAGKVVIAAVYGRHAHNGGHPIPTEEAQANAAHIVRCVNCFDELLAAAKLIYMDASMTFNRERPSMKATRDAIAKAEAQP